MSDMMQNVNKAFDAAIAENSALQLYANHPQFREALKLAFMCGWHSGSEYTFERVKSVSARVINEATPDAP